MADRCLLAVFAHPDDETFRPGGTLTLLARHEEGFLLQKYGSQYAAYRRSTGRFLPVFVRRTESKA